VAWLEGNVDEAEERSGRALVYFESAGRDQETAAALINLGTAARYAGNERLAVERLEHALAISRRIGYLEGVAWALHELGAISFGRDRNAAAMLHESLLGHVRLGDRWRMASVFETVAGTAWLDVNPNRAVCLIAAAHALRQQLGTPLPPVERPFVDAAIHTAQASLGSASFAEAWSAGLATSINEAVELAAPGRGLAGVRTDVSLELTEREMAVLRLVSQGLTNHEIGRELFISPGTAGVHVSNILRKLGVNSRVKAARIAHELGLST
jgi:DNA-binding CsgD family transcriptional regulator